MAIGDAAMVGARWILALDRDFTRRLLAGEEKAVKDWKRIGKHLAFYEQASPRSTEEGEVSDQDVAARRLRTTAG